MHGNAAQRLTRTTNEPSDASKREGSKRESSKQTEGSIDRNANASIQESEIVRQYARSRAGTIGDCGPGAWRFPALVIVAIQHVFQ